MLNYIRASNSISACREMLRQSTARLPFRICHKPFASGIQNSLALSLPEFSQVPSRNLAAGVALFMRQLMPRWRLASAPSTAPRKPLNGLRGPVHFANG
jgi:hypothetical protein